MGRTCGANTYFLWWIPLSNSRWQCMSAMPQQCPTHCQRNVLTHAEQKNPWEHPPLDGIISFHTTLGKATFPLWGWGGGGSCIKETSGRTVSWEGADRTGDGGSGTERTTVKKDNGDGWSPSFLHFSLSPSAQSLQWRSTREAKQVVDYAVEMAIHQRCRHAVWLMISTSAAHTHVRACTHTHTQGSCQLSLSADGGLEFPLQSSVCADSHCCCSIARPAELQVM